MPLLVLDTCVRGEARAWMVEERCETCWQAKGDVQHVLRGIHEHRTELSRLDGIAIVAGPGRFSALRVGIVYAHLLARWVRVPLYAITREEMETPEARAFLEKNIREGKKQATHFVVPVYDREPNITTPAL